MQPFMYVWEKESLGTHTIHESMRQINANDVAHMLLCD